MECNCILSTCVDSNVIISIVALVISVLSIVGSFICLYINIKSSKRFTTKQKMLNGLLDLVYFDLPDKVNQLIFNENPNKDRVREVKKLLVDTRRKFVFLKFRNEDKYEEIRNALMNLEDSVGILLSSKISAKKKRENIENRMKRFYDILDNYFDVSK